MSHLARSYHSARSPRTLLIVLIFTLLSNFSALSQEAAFDELTVSFQAKNIGTVEIPALIRDQQVLLPVNDIFYFLRLKSSMSAGMDSIFGFFLTPDARFRVDRAANRIVYKGRNYFLKPGDLVKTETNLYLLSKYFNDVFGLNCKFNFRTLSVDMTTQVELPMMREMRLEQMRQNVSRLKGENKVDTVIPQSRAAFHFGMADWSVITSQSPGLSSDTRVNIGLGGVIAGGETNAYLNYNTNEAFSEKQQYYYWRYVNNDNKFLRQTVLGKINTDAVSSIYNPVVGFRLTNAPTTYRRSFGTYPISDYTNPNWTVELYVNNVLVEYKKADASGFFTFQVPLVYGNSQIKLKFYGPYGEERSKEQYITVPFNFLPVREFEYNLSGGMVEDGEHSIYSKAALNYGFSNNITIGTGVEFLSSVTTGSVMPFVNFASRPFNNVLLSGEYVYGVRGRGLFSYTLPKNIMFELDYTKYKPGQMAVNFNYLEERKATLTLPFYGKNFSFYNRMTYNNIVLPGTGYSTGEWLVSGAVGNVSANLTNYAMFLRDNNPYVYTNLALSFRTPYKFLIIPQIQYEYSQKEFISAKIGLEKYFFKNGFFTLSYENNFKNKIQNMQVGFRYDLPFMQTAVTARKTNDQTTFMEMARGSLVFDGKNHYVGASNLSSVGKAGIVFAPFLDINCNNKRDPGEPRAYGLNIRISGGKSIAHDRDTTVRVTDLEPYAKYYVEMDGDGFDNVAWKLRMKAMSITADPNIFKLVEIPVSVVGEVTGTVMLQKSSGQEGLGRIILNIFNKSGKLAGRTLSEQDGYFSYLGLAPGDYEIRLDADQLSKLSLVATPASYQFTISVNRDGDIVEGKDFQLRSSLAEPGKPVSQNIQTVMAPPFAEALLPQVADSHKSPVAQAALPQGSEAQKSSVAQGAVPQGSDAQKLPAAQGALPQGSDAQKLPAAQGAVPQAGVGKTALSQVDAGKASLPPADASHQVKVLSDTSKQTNAAAVKPFPARQMILDKQSTAGAQNAAGLQPKALPDTSKQTNAAAVKPFPAKQMILDKQSTAGAQNAVGLQSKALPDTSKQTNAAAVKPFPARQMILDKQSTSGAQIAAGLQPKALPDTSKQTNGAAVKPFPAKQMILDKQKASVAGTPTAKESTSSTTSISTSAFSTPVSTPTSIAAPAKALKLVSIEQSGKVFVLMDPGNKEYFLQVGAFKNAENAQKLAKSAESLVSAPVTVSLDERLYKVRIGPFKSKGESLKSADLIVASK